MGFSALNVSKTYRGPVTALADVSLEATGGMFGLLGPNGAGKTTFMRLLAGVMAPTIGKVSVLGYALPARLDDVRRNMGYLPQAFGFWPTLTVSEVLSYFSALKGVSPRNGARDLLESTGLAGISSRQVRALSGGLRQRLGIAVCLLNDPKILIVDEPTAGLDPEARVSFRNLLAELKGERTVLLSTHIVADVESACPELAVLCGGRVVYRGTTPGLAALAEGLTYNVEIAIEEIDGLRRHGVVSRVVRYPTHASVRYISPQPVPGSEPAIPTVEDGYLWLVRTAQQV